MITFDDIWWKLSKSKKYRESYALSLLKRSVAFQIKTLRKKYFGSQVELAEAAGITQGVVSRAEDQDYGNLTLNTVGRIAGGFDMAFIGRFVPFSDLARFSINLSEEQFTNIQTFKEEDSGIGPMPPLAEYELFINPPVDAPIDSNFDYSVENGNIAASQREPEFNLVDTEKRKPMGTVEEQSEMAAAAAGNGGR
jgi:hypothetical protein